VAGAAAARQTSHIPLLRMGRPYRSLDVLPLADHATGAPLGELSLANSGLVRRDLAAGGGAAAALRGVPAGELLAIARRAADLFVTAELPAGDVAHGPEDYLRALAATGGMPHALGRLNMQKIAAVLSGMERVLHGLTRGLDPAVLDRPWSRDERLALDVSYAPLARALAAVLPSNSPGVNALWLPAIGLRVPVALKPGSQDPWTPLRIIQALLAAGLPPEALGYYPAGHEGAAALAGAGDRAIVFGDERTARRYRGCPEVSVHGPGMSKVVIGPDRIDRFEDHLDVLVASIVENGGRSCTAASSSVAPGRARDVADALAERLARVEPRPLADPDARLCAFPDPAAAAAIDASIDSALALPGARDLAAAAPGAARRGPGRSRRAVLEGSTVLVPAIILCDDPGHPLARRELPAPHAAVVERPGGTAALADWIGPTLSLTCLSDDPELIARLAALPHVQRLNLGPVPTTHVEWDQPHEGNLFDLLYRRRAIQVGRAPAPGGAEGAGARSGRAPIAGAGG
jgi:acyl-CoA reductase-like NAD-dependent aldehyde dehydrogenase